MYDATVNLLLWCLPIALSMHVFEEFAFPGGLKQWIKTYRPRKLRSNFYYFFINAAAIGVTCIIALTASRHLGLSIYLYFVALMTGNSLSHIRATIQKKRYCPVAISGALLFLPLFVGSSWYFLTTGKLDWLPAVLNSVIGLFFGFYVFGVDIRAKDGKRVAETVKS